MKNLLSIFYATCFYLAKIFPMLYPKKIILTFHSVGNDNWEHSHSIKQLKSYLMILQKLGYEFTELQTLLTSDDDNIKKCALTFDDGYKNLLSIKRLPKDGFPCHVFLLTDSHRVNRLNLKNDIDLLNIEEVNELLAAGWIIGSHGQTHPDFSKLEISELEKEIHDSKVCLENEYKQKILAFAFPNGKSNALTKRIVGKSGYLWGLTMDDGILTKNTNKYEIPRVGVMKYHQSWELAGAITILAIYARKIVKSLKNAFSI